MAHDYKKSWQQAVTAYGECRGWLLTTLQELKRLTHVKADDPDCATCRAVIREAEAAINAKSKMGDRDA